ncbi:MAG TPA: hypothetical protein VLN91_03360, partial [Nitrospirota bacterium]|nr:hypothetical protein [Nitrospirota bacterium]
SDHGFSKSIFGVNLDDALIRAGLKRGKDSTDLVTVGNDQVAMIHIEDRNKETICAAVSWLQKQPWVDVLFTAPPEDAGSVFNQNRSEGSVPGTFSMETIHFWNRDASPDILVTFPWSSEKNLFGLQGTDCEIAAVHGSMNAPRSSHGSMSPWVIRNTMIAWGPSVKKGIAYTAPVGIVDVSALLLKLHGLPIDEQIEGRVPAEALQDGADPEKVPVQTHVLKTCSPDGQYSAVLQISVVDDKRYVDKGWRTR